MDIWISGYLNIWILGYLDIWIFGFWIFGFWEQAVREAEVMKKKPLLLFRWDRSKDFAAYDDNTEVEDYVEISSFGHKFKISRLDDWIKAVKKADKLPKYREEK